MNNNLSFRLATLLKGLFLVFLFWLFSTEAGAQNAGINAGGVQPDPAAGLDVNFTSKGLLIPRVALISATSFSPLTTHVAGMVVYNLSANGGLKPGFYFNDGSKWIETLPKPLAAGEMQYWDGTSWAILPAGQPGQLLQINSSGIPVWNGGGYATMTTTAISAITSASASGGGNISSDGGNPVTSRGVCWATTPNPTIAGSKTVNGTGTGSYTSSITGLTTGTIYYIRAYATNTSGTSYGNNLIFTTP